MEAYVDRNRLVLEILEELKVTAAGQPAAASEIDTVDKSLDSALKELAARHIVPIADADAIPAEYLTALSQALARMMANKFSISNEETEAMFAKEDSPFSPENRLRAIKNSGPAYVPQVPDYF